MGRCDLPSAVLDLRGRVVRWTYIGVHEVDAVQALAPVDATLDAA